MQVYSDLSKEDDPHALPDTEVTCLKFLCYGVGAYGSGETYEQAMANYKEASGNTRCLVYMWIGELPHSAWGHEMGMSWRGTQERPILIQDNRLAKYRRNHPLEIGGEA